MSATRVPGNPTRADLLAGSFLFFVVLAVFAASTAGGGGRLEGAQPVTGFCASGERYLIAEPSGFRDALEGSGLEYRRPKRLAARRENDKVNLIEEGRIAWAPRELGRDSPNDDLAVPAVVEKPGEGDSTRRTRSARATGLDHEGFWARMPGGVSGDPCLEGHGASWVGGPVATTGSPAVWSLARSASD